VFSSTIEPVLRIWPGDTVRTRTVDAGGVDEKAKSRSLGGNPQTGPFYVEGAMPGDVLVVHMRPRIMLRMPDYRRAKKRIFELGQRMIDSYDPGAPAGAGNATLVIR